MPYGKALYDNNVYNLLGYVFAAAWDSLGIETLNVKLYLFTELTNLGLTTKMTFGQFLISIVDRYQKLLKS